MKLTERSNDATAFLSRPAAWLALALVFLIADYLTGEAIAFPIAFVLPVFLAAWNLRKKWAAGLAVVLPLLRLLMISIYWGQKFWPPPFAVLNMVIRAVVLLTLAIVTWRCREALGEVKMLKGLLPICMHCRKIRDENQQWQSLESYLSSHSETKLSHGLCPECAQKFYPEIFSMESDSTRSPAPGPGDIGSVS